VIVAETSCSYFRLFIRPRAIAKPRFSASNVGLMNGMNGAACIGLTRSRRNFSAIYYGIIPSNLLALEAAARARQIHV